MTPQDLYKLPEYQQLTQKKQQFLAEFVKNTTDLRPDQVLPVLLKAQNRMNALGISFTPTERSFFTQLLMSGLSPKEREQLSRLRTNPK